LNRFSPYLQAFSLILILACCFVPVQVANSKPIEIFVSILPQKNFVERIGGENVNVHVMVGPGQSPATYEPTPKQMAKLAQADIYFRIGTPFENVWMERIRNSNPALTIIDARERIQLRQMEHSRISPGPSTHHHGLNDPHIWTNPINVKQFMERFTEILSGLYPKSAPVFKSNYDQFATELIELDHKIHAIFRNILNKSFLVFHPSWGYFSDRYGLEQISIELEGKTPNAKELASVIDYAKQHNIKRVFVQKQFSQKDAQAVANAIGGKVIVVDPLAENYMHNLLEAAQQFAGSMT